MKKLIKIKRARFGLLLESAPSAQLDRAAPGDPFGGTVNRSFKDNVASSKIVRLGAALAALTVGLALPAGASGASFSLSPGRAPFSSGAGPFDWSFHSSSSPNSYTGWVGYKLSTDSNWHRCIGGSSAHAELTNLPDGTYSIDIADDINKVYLNSIGAFDSSSNTCGDPSMAPPGAVSRDTIVIDSTPPTVGAPSVTTAARTVQASVQASDSGTGVASYTWVFGDGAQETTAQPYDRHQYLTDGSYSGQVIVTDGAGNQAAQAFTASVVAAASPTAPPVTTSPPSAPSTPQLPWMTVSTGRTYTYNTVAGVLPRVFHHRYGYKASCTRRSAVRISCNARFSSGPTDYWGTVTSSYLFGSDNSLEWVATYSMHWVSDQCYFHSSHPSRCRIGTKRGRW